MNNAHLMHKKCGLTNLQFRKSVIREMILCTAPQPLTVRRAPCYNYKAQDMSRLTGRHFPEFIVNGGAAAKKTYSRHVDTSMQ